VTQPRAPQRLWITEVRRTERITPQMVRVTVGGDQLRDFVSNGTDQHVILYFYEADARLPEPLTLESARRAFSVTWPTMRTYTIRRVRSEVGELDIDFACHDGGFASGWAENATPGERLIFAGPSRAYPFESDVDCHLLAGDETALPAIGAVLEELPAGVRARVFVEVADQSEEQQLDSAADVELTWLHRDGVPAGHSDGLIRAVRDTPFPAGNVRAWVGAEAGTVRDLRKYFRDEHGLRRGQASATVYWRYGESEDARNSATAAR
jgi:NADPH-dependent ferric siderophore reductase